MSQHSILEPSAKSTPQLNVSIPTRLYDDWVTTEFGSFQTKNRADPTQSVSIDLSNCEFASPLPMLAMATELMTHSGPNRRLEINLGSWGAGGAAENKARTRKYLSIHGLLNAFTSRTDLDVQFQFDANAENGDSGFWYSRGGGDGHEIDKLRVVLERAAVDLIFGDSVVLSATTWLLPNAAEAKPSDAVRNKVDELLRHADQALFKFKTEARKHRDTTLHRLTQILLELVENSAEHAYLDQNIGYVGLYARVRVGTTESQAEWRAAELRYSPLLNRVLRANGQHQVEVFVVDVGRGLLADVNKWDECEPYSSSPSPLREISQKLFLSPLSRHPRNNPEVARLRGSSTGLMHLHEILQREHDSSRIASSREFVAGAHPRDTDFSGNAGTSGNFFLGQNYFAGTLFHIGLKPAEIPKLPAPWFESDDANYSDVRSSILNKLARSESSDTTDIVDIRYGTSFDTLNTAVENVAKAEERILVRFGRVAQKNYINKLIENWCKSFSDGQKERALLYLCDLGRSQAVDTAWIISQYFPRSVVLDHIRLRAAIYIVTEDLCCIQLRIVFKQLDNCKAIANLSIREVPLARVPDGLAYVLLSLRKHDSLELWKRINEINRTHLNPVLFRDVLWTSKTKQDRVLPWYLDFAALVQDRDAARLVRRGIRRLLALFPDANDQALDPIVKPSLHDAKKWLYRPPVQRNKLVLVGSLSVSGSTLSRHRAPLGVTVVGVVDSIQTPYSVAAPNSEKHHIAALLWDNHLEVQTSNAPMHRRIGSTAFIEPVDKTITQIDFDKGLYEALEASRLIKIGHWGYGEKHSLIDLNVELAIDQSAESAAGVMEWLKDRILELQRNQEICVAYPFNQLAYRLAHTVYAKLPADIRSRVHLLQLSFLPRHAGGLTRFTPATARAARIISKTKEGVIRSAVFVDIGFVTSRTLRHAARQLNAAGFRQVYARGLLNRSSVPALEDGVRGQLHASVDVIPLTYWRWNLPILGGRAHCSLCAALPSLARLRVVTQRAHPDLLPFVKLIAKHWGVHSVADFWEEHGVSPKALAQKQIDAIQSFIPQSESNLPTTSTTLTTKIIEMLRLDGDTERPISIARTLLTDDPETVIELMSCVLLLATSGIGDGDHENYVNTLIESVIGCDAINGGSGDPARRAALLELATLALSIQSTTCRLALLDEVVKKLSKIRIREPRVRIALIAFTIDADENERVQDAFKALCSVTGGNEVLAANYHSVRPVRANVGETWHKLDRVFGRTSGHSQQSMAGLLRSKYRDGRLDRNNALLLIDEIRNLLAQCDSKFLSSSIGINLDETLNSLSSIRKQVSEAAVSNPQICDDLDSALDQSALKIHGMLVRIGHGNSASHSPLVQMAFDPILAEVASNQGLSMADDIIATTSCRMLTWPQADRTYLPLCDEFKRLIKDLFENILQQGISCPPPVEHSDLPAKPARAWWWVDVSQASVMDGCSLYFLNGIGSEGAHSYLPSLGYLKDSLFNVSEGRQYQSGNHRYFETQITIPSLDKILKEIK